MYLVFVVQDEEYGLELDLIRTVDWVVPITRIPTSRPHVRGVVNLRGVIVPVVDLGSRLHGSTSTVTEFSRVVVTVLSGVEVGLLVDEVRDVVEEDAALMGVLVLDLPTLLYPESVNAQNAQLT